MVLDVILILSASAYLIVDPLDDAGVCEGKIPLPPHGNDDMLMNLYSDDVGGFYDSGGDGLVFP